MITLHNWTLRKDFDAAGYYHPLLRIRYPPNGSRLNTVIKAGYSDDVSLYRHERQYVVLSVNRSLGYCGLEVYQRAWGELGEIGDVFLQSSGEIEDILGKRGLDLENITIAHRLYQYVG